MGLVARAYAHGLLVDALHFAWLGLFHREQTGEANYYDAGSGLRTVPAGGLPAVAAKRKRVVCIADTHEYHGKLALPGGDILVVAGDVLLFNRRHYEGHSELKIQLLGSWLREQPFKDVVLVAGNHDKAFETLGKDRVRQLLGPRITYLEHEEAAVQGLKVFGTPKSHGTSNNRAFQSDAMSFADIPRGLDILVTHQPLAGKGGGQSVLADVLAEKRPTLHVAGHLHWSYGVKDVSGTTSVTASIMNERMKPTNPPIVFDLQVQ